MSKSTLTNFLEHMYEVTLALNAEAYSAGDVITTTKEIVLRAYANQDASRLRGRITNVRILDEDDQGTATDIVFMKNNVSLGTVGSAVSISDANAREIIGIIKVETTDYCDLINSQQADPDHRDIPFVLDSGELSLWVSAKTRGTPTYTATGVRLQVVVQFENQTIDTGT